MANMPLPDIMEAVGNLLMAAALGAAIGLEREHHGRSAGLRTQLLVAMGSALAMVVSLHFSKVFGGADAGGSLRVDPARVAYGVMGGVGFLGAGAIIRDGAGIRGLTTAASLWCSAAIGLACGFGMFAVAAAATAMVLFALIFLNIIALRFPAEVVRQISVTVPGASTGALERYAGMITQAGGRIITSGYTLDFTAGRSVIVYSVSVSTRKFPAVVRQLEQAAPEISVLQVDGRV